MAYKQPDKVVLLRLAQNRPTPLMGFVGGCCGGGKGVGGAGGIGGNVGSRVVVVPS